MSSNKSSLLFLLNTTTPQHHEGGRPQADAHKGHLSFILNPTLGLSSTTTTNTTTTSSTSTATSPTCQPWASMQHPTNNMNVDIINIIDRDHPNKTKATSLDCGKKRRRVSNGDGDGDGDGHGQVEAEKAKLPRRWKRSQVPGTVTAVTPAKAYMPHAATALHACSASTSRAGAKKTKARRQQLPKRRVKRSASPTEVGLSSWSTATLVFHHLQVNPQGCFVDVFERASFPR